jgi:DNA-binding Lrp family transcriptional regulator
MDRIDLDILVALEADARLSFADLAAGAGMSKTPSWKRVKALEAAGVITGYHAALSPAALGFAVEAFVQIVLKPEEADGFEASVLRHPLVWRCHATTGDGDYLVHLVAQDIAALDRVLRQDLARMPGVQRTRTFVATREIKSGHLLAKAARAGGADSS